MKVGCHISTRNGYLGAARTALMIGAQSFQFFPKNPRSLAIKSFDHSDAEACAAFCREQGLSSIGHAPYPANMAVEDGSLRQATVASLRNDLEIVDACGSIGIVVHFGKYKGTDPLQGYRNIIQCVNEVLEGYRGNAKLLIENQAGEGSAMGSTLEELVSIRQLCRAPEYVAYCLDTCHAFASGLWNGANWTELVNRGKELDYMPHLAAIHLNDSVYGTGSGRDRHANIGKGEIGVERFREFLSTPELHGLPIVLETGSGADRSHRDEIAFVKTLLP